VARVRFMGASVLAGVLSVGLVAGVVASKPASPAAAASAPALKVTMVVVPDSLYGSNKKNHDAYIPGSFSAIVGRPVMVTVYNLDTSAHSFTSTSLGLNVTMAPAPKDGVPGVTTFTFTPKKAGVFHWLCVIPCDNGGQHAWAMTHDGYMAGNVVVTQE